MYGTHADLLGVVDELSELPQSRWASLPKAFHDLVDDDVVDGDLGCDDCVDSVECVL